MARKAKQPRGKKMNSTFFVFCEGKTEAAYVDLLRRSFRMPVEIIAKVSDSNINQQYIDRCKRDRFTTKEDKTFLMFDLAYPGLPKCSPVGAGRALEIGPLEPLGLRRTGGRGRAAGGPVAVGGSGPGMLQADSLGGLSA